MYALRETDFNLRVRAPFGEPTMSSVGYLKQVVSDKLAAAAEEIFAVFHKAIVEYEEELDRHRKLLELAWKPEVKLHRLDLPRQCVFNEEVVVEEQSSLNRDRTSRVDEEELELPVMKEQQEEVSILEFRLKEEPEDLQIYFPDGNDGSRTDSVVDWTPEVSGGELQRFPFKKQLDRDRNVTVPTPSTYLIDNRRRHKFKNESKVQQNRRGNVDQTRESWRRGTLSQHKTIHTANEPYSCQECGKSFSDSSQLEIHEKAHRYAQRPHACTTCGKRFIMKSHLKEHEQIHIGVKSHVCHVCNKGFLLKKNMIKHTKIHTRERPHACLTCGKTFTQRSHLSQHVKMHQGEKRYGCKECGKSFSTSAALTYHVASAHYDF